MCSIGVNYCIKTGLLATLFSPICMDSNSTALQLPRSLASTPSQKSSNEALYLLSQDAKQRAVVNPGAWQAALASGADRPACPLSVQTRHAPPLPASLPACHAMQYRLRILARVPCLYKHELMLSLGICDVTWHPHIK
jgi:hypothetical protein